MRNYDKATPFGQADQKEALLANRVGRIGDSDGEWVAKGGGGFWERDMVLADVSHSLGRIPREAKRHAAKLVGPSGTRTA